jgi:2-keto-4-pentenoate hydratase/2-oxohepta-3-ene-1,7-dioic acid hydratase in catechol pathway
MAVQVVRFRDRGRVSWGVVRGDVIAPDGEDRGVVRGDAIAPIGGEFVTTGEFLGEGARLARALAGANGSAGTVRASEVELLCPITSNQQLVCQAINYRDHMIESGIDPDQQPYNVIFRKASSCLAPADTDIVRPASVRLLDYEVELGLVIGREIRGPVQVSPANLHEFVAALVVVDDVSARDVQLPQGQFYKGKSYRTFGPVGPYLVLVDAADLARLDDLRLRLWVNDEARQDGYAGGLVFKPAPTLTELSGLQDLDPGDVIATGTPGGCALRAPSAFVMFLASLMPPRARWTRFLEMGAKNPRFLKPGDRVRASIRTDDGAIDLGEQRNRVVAA